MDQPEGLVKGHKAWSSLTPSRVSGKKSGCTPGQHHRALFVTIPPKHGQHYQTSAHQVVQKYEDTTAAWIHAVLHKIEGDRDNSRYWYRRAGKLEHFSDEAREELGEIRKEVAAGS